jgi:hypothetical protein
LLPNVSKCGHVLFSMVIFLHALCFLTGDGRVYGPWPQLSSSSVSFCSFV